jgi:AcrR family transcriptional regulator
MSAAAARLPRGRHSLSREEVSESQRTRLLRAMADVMAEKGYALTSVAEIVRAARVSRETFYEQFASKEDCFMSAFEEAYALLVSATVRAPAGESVADPLERFELTLAAYLDALADNPSDARVFLIEVHAAGERALRRRAELQHGLALAVAHALGAQDDERRFAIEALLAAITALVTARLAVGDTEGLRALRAPLARFAAKALAA